MGVLGTVVNKKKSNKSPVIDINVFNQLLTIKNGTCSYVVNIWKLYVLIAYLE